MDSSVEAVLDGRSAARGQDQDAHHRRLVTATVEPAEGLSLTHPAERFGDQRWRQAETKCD